MIDIAIDVDDDIFYYDSCGHANYDPGRDIVCAAVSGLEYALIGYVLNTMKCQPARMTTGRGRTSIKVYGSREDLLAVWEMTTIGMLQLAMAYPDHVRVNHSGLFDGKIILPS